MDLERSQQEHTKYSSDAEKGWRFGLGDLISRFTPSFVSTRYTALSGVASLPVRVLRESDYLFFGLLHFSLGPLVKQTRSSCQSPRLCSSFTTLTNPDDLSYFIPTTDRTKRRSIFSLYHQKVPLSLFFQDPPARSSCHSFLYALAISSIHIWYNLPQVFVVWRTSRG